MEWEESKEVREKWGEKEIVGRVDPGKRNSFESANQHRSATSEPKPP